ncbi:MAG: imidazole glycerol phosphate synthase subunit HisH [Myxococcota bacterium]
MSTITIIETGLANLASVQAAWRRLGHDPLVTKDPDVVGSADRVMLPGVGAFAPGMAMLNAHGLTEALRERVAQGRPLLAVCLGLQLLGQQSEEGPGIEGLGIVEASAERLQGPDRVPHMGWAPILPTPNARYLVAGHAYFAHSYAIRAEGLAGASSAHSGRRFVAAIEHGPVLALQFHPELSGSLGESILARWAEEG